MSLKNKVAMITGASVGIGRAVALKMAEEGASLILLDVNKQTLEALKKEISFYQVNTICYVCDVSNEDEVIQVTKDALEKFERIDILVNNAALWRNFESFLEISTAKWKTFFDINVMGVVHCTRAVLPTMIENAYGRIINVASVAGVYGNANMTVYSATKGAVISMTRALAKEVACKGVTVNCVSPGTVSPSDNPDLSYTQESTMNYSERTGSGMENANLICFLADEQAGYIVGQNIQIDGCRKNI